MGPREEDLARKARGGEMAYLRKVTRLSQLKAPLEASSLPSSVEPGDHRTRLYFSYTVP